MQPSVCCGSIIGFGDSLPLHLIRFKDFLNAVIVGNIPEPSVQLGEQNQVKVMTLHTIKKPDEFLALCVSLASCQSFIDKGVHKHKMIPDNEVIQNLILCFQRITMKDLVIVRASDIFADAHSVQFGH